MGTRPAERPGTPLAHGWRRRALLVALCAGALTAAGHPPSPAGWQQQRSAEHGQIESAYFDGRLVRFELAPVPEGEQPFTAGPWRFGARVASKPHDRRLNLYLVAPGRQHRTPGWEAYDHNDVINALPLRETPQEWDVYWAIVLDPALRRDLRTERDLLLEAQTGFRPGDMFALEDIPGRAFLQRFVGAESMRDLRRFRRRDGLLPRLIIVPAGFAIRGSAYEIKEEEEVKPEEAPARPGE
jgi:hypothetical protein